MFSSSLLKRPSLERLLIRLYALNLTIPRRSCVKAKPKSEDCQTMFVIQSHQIQKNPEPSKNAQRRIEGIPTPQNRQYPDQSQRYAPISMQPGQGYRATAQHSQQSFQAQAKLGQQSFKGKSKKLNVPDTIPKI